MGETDGAPDSYLQCEREGGTMPGGDGQWRVFLLDPSKHMWT